MVLAEHITYGTDKPCTENFVKPPTEKIPLGRCQHNATWNERKRVGSMNRIHFSSSRDPLQDLVTIVPNPPFHQKAKNFLTS